jgi:hypothetical protein
MQSGRLSEFVGSVSCVCLPGFLAYLMCRCVYNKRDPRSASSRPLLAFLPPSLLTHVLSS